MKAKHFNIRELVPPRVYYERGEKAWELIDTRLIFVLEELRKLYGVMIVNTWHSEALQNAYGLREYSGFRTWEFYGSTPDEANHNMNYSQHRFGRAADILFRDAKVDDVRSFILNNPDVFTMVGGIELDVSWLHVDVRNYDGIKTFWAS